MLVYDQLQKVYKFIDKYMDAINENSIKELKNLIGALDNTFLEKRHAKDTVNHLGLKSEASWLNLSIKVI